MGVDVTVLSFGGCPSWQTAIERLHTASARTGVHVRVRTQAVESPEDADLWGFTGSPTILLDGIGPFGQPDDVSALACRVYATPDGLAASLTVDQLVDALTRHSA